MCSTPGEEHRHEVGIEQGDRGHSPPMMSSQPDPSRPRTSGSPDRRWWDAAGMRTVLLGRSPSSSSTTVCGFRRAIRDRFRRMRRRSHRVLALLGCVGLLATSPVPLMAAPESPLGVPDALPADLAPSPAAPAPRAKPTPAPTPRANPRPAPTPRTNPTPAPTPRANPTPGTNPTPAPTPPRANPTPAPPPATPIPAPNRHGRTRRPLRSRRARSSRPLPARRPPHRPLLQRGSTQLIRAPVRGRRRSWRRCWCSPLSARWSP